MNITDTVSPCVIAFYLPQFHPIPENDEWWGKGFTEWTNVVRAKKYYKGHYQPRFPADLGFYDLRVPEVREAQVRLARAAGISGFCYWHYWFDECKQLLERPLNEVLSSGTPDFPFCLGWANESWFQKTWVKDGKDKLLIEQKYNGVEDYVAHFTHVLRAFKDKRYIKVNGKPLFMVYKPFDSPEIPLFIKTWRRLAEENNLPGIHFIAHSIGKSDIDSILKLGFNSVNTIRITNFLFHRNFLQRIVSKINREVLKRPTVESYLKASRFFLSKTVDSREDVYPSIISGWDHSPRSGKNAVVLRNYTPENFRQHVKSCFSLVYNKRSKIIFLKSWNEWAEGNYLEPDMRYGDSFIRVLADEIKSSEGRDERFI